MEKAKNGIKTRIYDLLIATFIVVSLLLTVFRFAPVFTRLLQSFVDIGTSLGYYVTEMMGFYDTVSPTVTNIPAGIDATLPMELSVFLEKWHIFWERLFDWDNFTEYLGDAALWLSNALMIITTLAPPLIACFALFFQLYKDTNNDYSEKTKQRLKFERFESAICEPTKRFIKGFFARLKSHKKIFVFLILLWLYNLNVFTIANEFLAYWYYMAIAGILETDGLFAFFIKLVCDLGVAVGFLPTFVWVILGIKLFDMLRKRAGDFVLDFGEACNRAFLALYICALFITGKQRAKKTSILTDMKLTLERLFRDKAQEKMEERDMQFPFFNWIHLELIIKRGQNGRLNTLYRCRRFIRELKFFFYTRDKYSEKQTKQILKHLKKKWGYNFKDFIFEYEHERYGLEYNNGINTVEIFEALEKYAQLFKIYAQKTPLDVANYSIREDLKWEDEGNFPVYDGDFFDRTEKDVRRYSQYSHVIPYNAFRLGHITDPNDEFKDSVEYGIGVAAEFAKERGNKDTKRGLKKTAEEANQENDLFEIDVKMRGHAATIDNYTFFRWIFDDQRAGSLGANNKDLTNICYVKEVSEARIVMPGFKLEEWLYKISTKIFTKLYYKVRFYRGDANNTLFIYLLKKLYIPIFNHYWRIFNRYSVYVAHLRVTDGMDGEVLESDYKYYLATAKVYANRFATDSYNEFYSQKAARSSKGLNNIPMYKGVRPTYEELCAQNSYFIADISEAFGVENKEIKPSYQEEETAKRTRRAA